MKRIIKNVEKLKQAASPIVFWSEAGIDKAETAEIISQLKEVLEAHKDIVALAAPQIGIGKRIFALRFDNAIKFFVNPILTKKQKHSLGVETFASMPGKEIFASRPEEVSAVYYTEDFKYEDNKLLGQAARLFDQQCQLLDGVTPDEIGLVSDVKEDGPLADLTEDEWKELIEIYKQFVKAKSGSLESAIQEDEDYAEQYKSLKFTEAVINGRAAIVDQGEAGVRRNRAQRRADAKLAKKLKAKARSN